MNSFDKTLNYILPSGTFTYSYLSIMGQDSENDPITSLK